MTFHVASLSGDGFCLAYRLHRDGHDVSWSIKARDGRAIGKGLVQAGAPSSRDVVVYDAVDLAKAGRGPHIGGNVLESWETHRGEGTKVMAEYGLAIPETYECKRLNDALDFLKKTDGEWYFKPDGDAPKSMTRKGDSETLLRFLAWAAPQLRKVPRFELQAPIEDGIELDVGVWLNASGPVAYEVCIEEKKFLYDNLGPSTGCQSNVLWGIPDRCKLSQVLDPYIEPLVRSGYVGLVGLNTMWTKKAEPYGLEWTMRLGFDSTQAALQIWPDVGTDLALLAEGRGHGFTRSKKAGMTLRLSTPPQPMESSKDDKTLEGLPLDIDLLDKEWFLPDDIALDADGKPICATGSGFIGTVGTTGTSLDAMRAKLVGYAKDLNIPDLMYRSDPVSRADDALTFIRKHNLCPDPFA